MIRRLGRGRRPAAWPLHADHHTATLLPNGKVLVAGGARQLATLAARSYMIRRPGRGRRPAAWPLHATCHTATLLPNGQVLVAGGRGCCPAPSNGGTVRSGERDLDGHRQLKPARFRHTATLLPNGKVLVSGGNARDGILARASCMNRRRKWSTFNSALSNLVGNSGLDWRAPKPLRQRKLNQQDRKKRTSMKTECTSRFAFLNPRVLIGFALYAAGLVLAFGAMSSAAAGDNAAAELSQSVPAQAPGTWTVTGDLVTARDDHTATLLPNGQVLVAGGVSTMAAS